MTTRHHGALDETLATAGARFHGTVAVDFGSVAGEVAAGRRGVGLAVADATSTTELRGTAEELLALLPVAPVAGRASLVDGRWWCPVSPQRVLVLDPRGGRPGPVGLSTMDLTAEHVALWVLGPLAERLLRTTGHLAGPAPDGLVRVRAGRPRALVLRLSRERFLVQVPAATAAALWRTLATAAPETAVAAVGRDAERLLAVCHGRGER